MGRRARKKRRRGDSGRTVNLSCDDSFQELMSWLRGLDCQPCQQLRPALFPGIGRGLQTLDNIAAGAVLVSIPLSALVTRQSVLSLAQFSSCPEPSRLSSQTLLSLWLCREAPSPYLSSLPTSYTNPYFTSQQERNLLPSYLKDLISAQQSTVDRAFLEACKVMPGLSRDSFDWAWFTVNTRAVYLDTDPRFPPCPCPSSDQLALAPYLDLLNHSSEAEMTAGLNLDPGAPPGYHIVTKKPVKKHDQVFINYGPHSNTVLLMEYGFLLPHNQQDGISLQLSQLVEYLEVSTGVPVCSWRQGVVREARLQEGLAVSVDGGLSWNARAALRVLTMSAAEFSDWRQVYGEEPSGVNLPQAAAFLRHLGCEVSSSLSSLTSSLDSSPALSLCRELLLQHREIIETVLAREQ